MLVVRIELWPRGDKLKARTLCAATIVNDGTGTPEFGNYKVILSHSENMPKHVRKGPYYKDGIVTGFMRSLSPYHLVLRALKSALDNPETPTDG